MRRVGILSQWFNHSELLPNWDKLLAKPHYVDKPQWDEFIIQDNASEEVHYKAFEEFVNTHENSRIERYPTNDCIANINSTIKKMDTDIILYMSNDAVIADIRWLEWILKDLVPGQITGPWGSHQEGIDYVEGSAVAMYKADWVMLAGYDPAFIHPGYWADPDLSWRAKMMGMQMKIKDCGLKTLGHVTSGGPAAPGFWDRFGTNHLLFRNRLKMPEAVILRTQERSKQWQEELNVRTTTGS